MVSQTHLYILYQQQRSMQNSKALAAKQKKIQKRQRAKLRTKAEKIAPFSFQNQMIDLIESSDHLQNNVQLQAKEGKERGNAQMIAQTNKQKDNDRIIKIDNDEYYLIVEVGKFYKLKKENQKHTIRINLLLPQQEFTINGLKCNTYSSPNPFIFSIQRSSPVQFKNFLINLSTQAKQKITKSMINVKKQTLIKSSSKIDLQETTQPWANLPKCIDSNDSLMLVGVKNTGKSTLAEYLHNSKANQCIILDCDIGRNSCMQGCVSLSSGQETKKIWIGELTPLNNLQTYLRAIRYLFQQYKQKWFTKKLVVNTMGYLTGLGQFLLYQIYQIIKPQSILILQSKNEAYYLSNIIHNIKSGKYVNKLYVSESLKSSPSSTDFYYYENIHCFAKKSLARFQKMFQGQQPGEKVNSIVDLIQMILKSDQIHNKTPHLKLKKRAELEIYEQSRHGKEQMDGQQVVSYRQLSLEESVDMRLVILGKMIEENQSNHLNSQQEIVSSLFEVSGLGFGFKGKIYFKKQSEGSIGIVNEGMDFEKGFYHLNEKQLIDLQLRMGRLNFMMVATQGLGSKGVRNNPSKMT